VWQTPLLNTRKLCGLRLLRGFGYPLLDKTNRHGILHGAYKDADYGRPINFYKAIGVM
jgi:hypothetical protein